MHRDFAQVLATTWSRYAFASCQLETGAMHRAYKQSLLAAQEFTGCPIQSAPGMRADIEPGAHGTSRIAMHDQRLRIAIHHRLDFVKAIRGQTIQLQQGRMRARETITI